MGIIHYVAMGLMAILFVYSLLMWLYTSSVWGFGGVFWSSWMTFALVYLGTAVFLRMKGVSALDSFIICLTSTVSMVWLYEILYHFSFWDSWTYGKPPYFFLRENVNFLSYGLIAMTALSGYKYAKTKWWFWLLPLTMTGLWIFWITIGFPQIETPQVLYDFAWPKIIIANPHAFAFPLNSITKFLLGLSYILLYLPSRLQFSVAKKGVKHFLVERGFL
jgi:hypothetical protein